MSVYILGWSDFVRRDAAGEVLLEENVGSAEIRMISVELKRVEGFG